MYLRMYLKNIDTWNVQEFTWRFVHDGICWTTHRQHEGITTSNLILSFVLFQAF